MRQRVGNGHSGNRRRSMTYNNDVFYQALGNRYWPAFYLYDAAGRLLATRIGELHAGEAGADAFERLLASRLPIAAGEQQ